MLAACAISDALITWIPADEGPLCGNAAVYAIIIVIIITYHISWTHVHLPSLVHGYLLPQTFLFPKEGQALQPELKDKNSYNGILVPVRTSFGLCRHSGKMYNVSTSD